MCFMKSAPEPGGGPRVARWRGRRDSGGCTAAPSTSLRLVPLPVQGRI
jgi:hypothetical protein